MKTDQDFLDFYGVEIGKKYKITRQAPGAFRGQYENMVFEVFKDGKELLFKVKGDHEYEYTYYIDLLKHFDYEEVKPEILDAKEKEYLSAVIKPFRNRVVSVSKQVGAVSKREFIKILLYNEDHCTLPFFEPNQICKGMEANKWYTLEELGL